MAKANEPKRKIITRKEVTLNIPVMKVPAPLQGFVNFIREQGVVGLAVGLVLGVAGKGVVDSFVNNMFNPVVGLLTGGIDLGNKAVCIKRAGEVCTSNLAYGQLISDIISFIIIVAAVYLLVHFLKLDRLDKKKE